MTLIVFGRRQSERLKNIVKQRRRPEGQKGDPRVGKKKNKKVADETLNQDPVVHALIEEVNRCEAKVNRYLAKAMEAFGPYKIVSKTLIQHLRAKETDPDKIAHFNEMLKKLDLIEVQRITFPRLFAGGSGSA
jgi:hypothetical protein